MRTAIWFFASMMAIAPAAFSQTAPTPPAATPAPASSRWPMVADSLLGQITIYKPQLEDFQGDQLTGRAAVSLLRPGQTDPVFGAIWITSRLSVDRTAQTAAVVDVQITKARFPDLQPADQQALTDAIRQRMLQDPPVLSLSHILAGLEVVKKEQAAGDTLQTAPPKIVYVEHPAVKVQYDGKPRFVQAGNDPTILVASNTPFLVALNLSDKEYYLFGAGQWFVAPDALGPFTAANGVPASISNLVQAAGGQAPAPANPDEAATEKLTPQQLADVQIITATEPTELLWTDGPAQMSSVQGTDLLYVANTPADLFLNIDNQQWYVLLSGRWYSAPNHNGPWTFVPPDKLPADFAKIPPDSDRGTVLAQVPGTPQAQDAVMNTYIPQTATIDRAQAARPTVSYDGDPQFQQIDQTTMAYAVNTASSVIWVNNQYYCCWNGVWYVSNIATGPWDVCVSVPGVIYTLPPSCPLYPCRYVVIYGYTPQWVYCGYTPGYVGCYVYRGVVVYGTGYAYRPWIGRMRYFARPCTFGFAAQYDPYTNFWGFDIGFGWGGSWVQPRPHIAGEGGGWFGYGGYRPVGDRGGRVTIRHSAVKDISVVRNSRFAGDNVYSRRTDVRAVAGPRPAAAPMPRVLATPDLDRPDVMSDSQGNIYRKTTTGWERRQGDAWVGTADTHTPANDHADHATVSGDTDSGDMHQLNQDYHARIAAEQRDEAREQRQQQSSGGGGGGHGGNNQNGNANQNQNNNGGNGGGGGGGGGGRNH